MGTAAAVEHHSCIPMVTVGVNGLKHTRLDC